MCPFRSRSKLIALTLVANSFPHLCLVSAPVRNHPLSLISSFHWLCHLRRPVYVEQLCVPLPPTPDMSPGEWSTLLKVNLRSISLSLSTIVSEPSSIFDGNPFLAVSPPIIPLHVSFVNQWFTSVLNLTKLLKPKRIQRSESFAKYGEIKSIQSLLSTIFFEYR